MVVGPSEWADFFAICKAFGLGKILVDRNYFIRLYVALVVEHKAPEISVVVAVIAI